MEFINFIIDFILHIDIHLEQFLAAHGAWIYGLLALIVFCETGLVVTPFLPGDSLLFAAGAVAAIGANHIDVNLMAVIVIAAAFLGDTTNYTIGRFVGQKLFSNPRSKILKKSYLDKTHNFYEKHGRKTIIIARFVPIVRTFAPFVAGMGRMKYRNFAGFSIVASLLWVGIFMYAGYFFGELEFVRKNLSVLMLAIILLSVLPGVIGILQARMKTKK